MPLEPLRMAQERFSGLSPASGHGRPVGLKKIVLGSVFRLTGQPGSVVSFRGQSSASRFASGLRVSAPKVRPMPQNPQTLTNAERNRLRRGNRAGSGRKTSFNRSVERDSERFDVHNSTTDKILNGSANKAGQSYSPAMFPGIEIDETVDSHLIPRKAITSKQRLGFKSTALEGIYLEGSLPEKVNGEFTGRMIKTSDAGKIQITSYAPKSLLKSSNPFAYPSDFKRETSRSKRIIHDRSTTTGILTESDIEQSRNREDRKSVVIQPKLVKKLGF